MSAYSLIIKLYHKVSWMGLSSGQDMNRVTFSVVAIMLLAAATTLPFVLNAGFGKAPQGAQLSLVEQSPNYRDGQFHNQLPTPGFTGQKTCWPRGGFSGHETRKRAPQQPLPLVNTDLPVCRLVKTSWSGSVTHRGICSWRVNVS